MLPCVGGSDDQTRASVALAAGLMIAVSNSTHLSVLSSGQLILQVLLPFSDLDPPVSKTARNIGGAPHSSGTTRTLSRQNNSSRAFPESPFR
jgi:hypothetical protein